MLLAVRMVAKWFGVAVKPLKSVAEERELPKRFKVSCTDLTGLYVSATP